MRYLSQKFVLLLLITFWSYTSFSQSGWTDPSGDAGYPFLEIWIYGASTPEGTLEPGDQIAAFDGTKLVGLLTLSVTPDIMNWNSSHLLAYSKSTDGTNLFQPEKPLIIKCWDASENKITDAFTWGDGKQIDFHNRWYAPTSDNEQTAVTYGAFFPAQSNSYCYVNVNSTEDAAEYATLTISLFDNNEIPQPVTGASITAGEFIAIEADPPDGTYTLELYAGYNITPYVDYNYIVDIDIDGFNSESFNTIVHADNNAGVGYQETVYLNTFGVVEGYITCYNINTGLYDSVPEQAEVNVNVFGTMYSGITDANGYYIIDSIPDGSWPLSISFTGYNDDESTAIIPVFDTLTYNVNLDPLEGGFFGRIYDITTMMAIEDEIIRISLQDTLGNEVDFSLTNENGEYELSYYPGTYNIIVLDNNPGATPNYQMFVIENYLLYPESNSTIDFDLAPDPYVPHFDTIFGNEDYVWNIKIEYAKFGLNFTVPFDELVIFDTDQNPDPAFPDEPGKRVGVAHFTQIGHYLYASENVLKAYGQFEDGSQGFIEGNNIAIWGYDVSHDAVYENPVQWWFNQGTSTYFGNTFPNSQDGHESFLNIYWDSVSGILTGLVTELTSPGSAVEDACIEVLDYYTNELLYTDTTNSEGNYKIFIEQGQYNIRFSKTGLNTICRNGVIITENVITELDVEMDNQESLRINYTFENQGFYFIGRSVNQDNDNMLTLFDNPDIGYDLFSIAYLESWIENDQQQLLSYSTDISSWAPANYTWDITKGYLLYIEQPYEFSIEGFLVAPSLSGIEFPSAGIYYIPYYPYSADESSWDEAIVAFESILDNLDWVMDSRGNRLHHNNGVWIDNIGTLSPAQGYKVKINGSVTLTYPLSSGKKKKRKRTTLESHHFEYNGGNAANWTYTIYINTEDFDIGDEIAAFSNGIMVGSMVIDSENAWENDLNMFNEAVNGGYEINSDIELLAWDASENIDYSVNFEMVNINESAYIGTTYPGGLDHFSYINLFKGTVEVDENNIDNVIKIYPNPTNGKINICSSTKINEIKVYNIYGSTVLNTKVNSKIFVEDFEKCIPGLYIVKVETESGVFSKQIVIK